MAVARTDATGAWQMLGLLTFLDPPRPDTRRTLEAAAGLGVQTRMVRVPAPFLSRTAHISLLLWCPAKLCSDVSTGDVG